MKTAITLLHEMMMKKGQTPEYECIAQLGPLHQATFEYRCAAGGETGSGIGRSKKAAKQEAARAVLAALAARGQAVPPGALPDAAAASEEAAGAAGKSTERPRYKYRLQQKVADYHLGVMLQALEDGADVAAARAAADAGDLQACLRELKLVMTFGKLGEGLTTLQLMPTSPELLFAGDDAATVERHAVCHLQIALAVRLPDPPKPAAT